jgi:ferredoxin
VSDRFRLVLDPVACAGHGVCAELYPEGIEPDDWGFPIVHGDVLEGDLGHARRAVAACPALALRMARRS